MPYNKDTQKPLQLYLSKELFAELEKEAKSQGRKAKNLGEKIIQDYFDKRRFISSEDLILERIELHNPNGFYIGQTGSGKSYAAKIDIPYILRHTKDDIIVIDTTGEYSSLCDASCGIKIKLSSNEAIPINPMEPNKSLNDSSYERISFLLLLIEELNGKLNAMVKQLIASILEMLYGRNETPTFTEFIDELTNSFNEEVKAIGQELVKYRKTFEAGTKADIDKRLAIIDTHSFSGDTYNAVNLVAADFAWKQTCNNIKFNKRTWIFMDGFDRLVENDFIYELYRRCRTRGGIITVIAQNIDLKSQKALREIANSEFIRIFKHHNTYLKGLAEVLDIDREYLDMEVCTHSVAILSGKKVVRIDSKQP